MDLEVAYPEKTRTGLLSRIGMHACFALAGGLLIVSLALGDSAAAKLMILVP